MLLIRRDGEIGWHAPEVTSFQDEALLQRIIVGSPSPLAGSTRHRGPSRG